ncbi:MAG: DUF4065 domain-containing protein [Bacillus sp. (in: Bacteria)]|nr:DUF4065 domain-containing protein [Bacillus sp. (in: firmicutes)]MCM1427325.1 DUF4065 domain-containing protein [Eubacterium sp.]
MVSALNVGNSILSRAFAENIDITPMKLQKMIYFIYRAYLQESNKSLFNERFEVWKYGPVIPSVYESFKDCGSNAIRKFATENDGRTVLIVDEDGSPIVKKIITDIWNTCKTLDGIYLSSLTHQEGTAWRKAFEENIPYLLDEDIKSEVVVF